MEIDPEALAKQAGVVFTSGRDAGTTLSKLAHALRKNGVTGLNDRVGVTLSELAAKTRGSGMAIVQVMVRRGNTNASHTVVVDEVTLREGRRVVAVRDPAGGREYFVPVEQFGTRMNRYGGRVLFLNQVSENSK